MFKKIFTGLIVGFVSGMFASGGGLLLVPIYNRFFGSDERQTRATTVFCILPMVLTTGIVYGANMNFRLGILCAFGGVFGSFIGSRLLQKLDTKYLKLIFIIFIIYSGLKILLS